MATYRKSVREILRRRTNNKNLKNLYRVSLLSGIERALPFMENGDYPKVHYKKVSLWQKIKRAFRKLFTFRKGVNYDK